MNLIVLARLVVIIGGFLVCIAGHAQEDDPIGDGLTSGPGLFSGEDGAFTLYENKSSDTKKQSEQNKKVAKSEDEFEAFKVYLKAKADNTEEYKTFLMWLEYQAYLKQKQ